MKTDQSPSCTKESNVTLDKAEQFLGFVLGMMTS